MGILLHTDGKGILYPLWFYHLTALWFLSLHLDHSLFDSIVVANLDLNHFFSFVLVEMDDLENALFFLVTKKVFISEPKDA